jgi:hypothetical protein
MPPTPVVLTDWLSMMPALGCGRRPTRFDQIVVKLADCNKALLERGVGQPDAGIEMDNVGVTPTRPLREVSHVTGNLGALGG